MLYGLPDSNLPQVPSLYLSAAASRGQEAKSCQPVRTRGQVTIPCPAFGAGPRLCYSLLLVAKISTHTLLHQHINQDGDVMSSSEHAETQRLFFLLISLENRDIVPMGVIGNTMGIRVRESARVINISRTSR
ncbi:hypothetical protein PGTUg99_033379 [Puccinia graminis f. sp. tritici]|uniref:Uncharacterized protein n=1 Tax=Puccinia graminis f. sp. tritici TaxID=56615 RepID=A0A5B0MFP9_PUCGR|nr:hypothetical protein PGTUg99_033379 [Puccinia graminis f. sp. tritici]